MVARGAGVGVCQGTSGRMEMLVNFILTQVGYAY